MIRRGFWLAAGAVLGIAGYRRATRLARQLQPASQSLPAIQAARRKALPAAARLGRESSSFVRDVRTGMAEYLDERDPNMNRHPGRLGNTLVAQHARRAGERPGTH